MVTTQSQALKQISQELCRHERKKTSLEKKREKCKVAHHEEYLKNEIKKIKTEMRICLDRMAALNRTILASLKTTKKIK
jgi:hypothetical protein